MAEIIFGNPADMHPTIAELVKRDFAVRFLEDWYDEYSAAVWILATASSELDQSAFFDSVKAIVEPLGGEEAGLAPDDIEAWIASKT